MASSKFAAKCEEAGVDAIVAEGFEAGGHNGREETTTLCLLPAIKKLQPFRLWQQEASAPVKVSWPP